MENIILDGRKREETLRVQSGEIKEEIWSISADTVSAKIDSTEIERTKILICRHLWVYFS
jgi:hypothetical protein